MKNKKILVVVAVILLVCVIGVVGFTFARYQSIGESNINPKVAKWHVLVNNIDISDGKTKTFTANIDWNQNDNIYNNGKTLIAPGSKGVVSFDIDASTSQVSVKYNIKLDTSELKDHKQIKITKITSTQDGKETIINETEEFNGLINLEEINKPVTIKVYIEWDPEINDEDDYNLGTKDIPLSIGVEVTISQKVNNTLAETIINNAKELGGKVEGRTEYNKENETYDEKTLNITEDDYGTSYYYSGNVQDNFLNFAGKCFRIVRIQGDGSVKIILDDKTQECQNAEGIESTTYEGEIAGSIGQANAIIGKAVYGYTGSCISNDPCIVDYENNVGGIKDNQIGAKQMIDEWINSTGKISESDKSKLKEEYWCLGNQNKWYDKDTWEEITVFSEEQSSSETRKKIYHDGTYDLKCGEESDKVSDLGGLLTAEEVELTGPFKEKLGWKSYLWTDDKVYYQWLANPSSHSLYGNNVFTVGGKYLNADSVNKIHFIRPALVLQAGIEIIKGDGTQQNPYIV